MAEPDDYLNLVDAARYLGIHPQSLRRLMKRGVITAVRPWEGHTAPWLLEKRELTAFKNRYDPTPGRKDYGRGRLL